MNKNKLKTALLILPFILLVIGVAQFAWHGDEGLYGSPKNPIYGTWNATISDSQGKEVYVEMVYNDDNSCVLREYDDQRKHHKELDTGRFELESGKISIWWESARNSWDKDGPEVSTFEVSGDELYFDGDDETVWKKKKK